MARPTLLHLIDFLDVGGAETLLANTVPLLDEFDHVVCHLTGPTDLAPRLAPHPVHELGLRTLRDLPRTVLRLSRLVRRYRPSLVHSHLMRSTLVGRLALPPGVPLVTTLHNVMSKDAYEQNPMTLRAERLTAWRTSSVVTVSRTVLDDYLAWVRFRGQAFVVPNYIPDRFFAPSAVARRASGPFRCIAVGNLRAAKNHMMALRSFRELGDVDIELDIFGEGVLRGELQAAVERDSLRVALRGVDRSIHETFRAHDLFVSTAHYEGYGLTVVEAMASGLPVVVSDLPVFREVTGGHAIFVRPGDDRALADVLRRAATGEVDLSEMAERGRVHAQAFGRRERYLRDLRNAYERTLAKARG